MSRVERVMADDETWWRAQLRNPICPSSHFLLRFLCCFLCELMFSCEGGCLVFPNGFLNEGCLGLLSEDLGRRLAFCVAVCACWCETFPRSCQDRGLSVVSLSRRHGWDCQVMVEPLGKKYCMNQWMPASLGNIENCVLDDELRNCVSEEGSDLICVH